MKGLILTFIWITTIFPIHAFTTSQQSLHTFKSVSNFSDRTLSITKNIVGRGRPFVSHSKTISCTSLSMCICINCKYVTNCAAYHFVEERHSQPHMTENPTFTPQDGSPTIHVNIRSQYDAQNSEGNEIIRKMWREYKQEEEAAMKGSESSESGDDSVTGPTTYNLSSIGEISYEYDVVKCENYVEEMGCWVTNMPQEIREANPEFVPT